MRKDDMHSHPDLVSSGRAAVATILEPVLRTRVDAAGEAVFSAVHSDSVSDAMRTMRSCPVRALLVSPQAIGPDQLPGLDALATQFPGVPAVAVVSQHDPLSSARLLELGARGVRRMVDVTVREGWSELRRLVAEPDTTAEAMILSAVLRALGETTLETHRFFEVLIDAAPQVSSVKAFARALRVLPSTLMSRFYRAELPSPKRYLAATRLLYAAAWLESPGLSIADVAFRLEYSSPQSFGRHVRLFLGLTAAQFRYRYRLGAGLAEYTTRLITPFGEKFRSFRPF